MEPRKDGGVGPSTTNRGLTEGGGRMDQSRLSGRTDSGSESASRTSGPTTSTSSRRHEGGHLTCERHRKEVTRQCASERRIVYTEHNST